MGTSAQIAITSGIFSLFFIILFSIETRRGTRFGESLRAVLDRLIVRVHAIVREYVPEINSLFLQELFFYILHVSLSRVLMVVRSVERMMLRIVRFNRMQAQKLKQRTMGTENRKVEIPPVADVHFSELRDHKKATELSPKEKTKRKEASIDGGTF